MDLHRFDTVTGEYIGVDEDGAKLDPLETALQGEDVYLEPAYSSFEPPLPAGANEVCVMNSKKGMFVVPDYRGTAYWLADGSKHTINAIGFEPPIDALFVEPIIPEAEETEEQKIEIAINSKIREIAIQALKADDQIDTDFEEPVIIDVRRPRVIE